MKNTFRLLVLKPHFSFFLLLTFWSLNTQAGSIDTIALSVSEAIRSEATRPDLSEVGRPLPLAAHWNTGQLAGGFSPAYQMQLIQQGHHILSWFQMPDPYEKPLGDVYYEGPVKEAARHGLPISFVGTEWERYLSDDPAYSKLPGAMNPNVVTKDRKVKDKVSPFGPVAPWYDLGKKWTTTKLLQRLQAWYPNPPLVLFLSNNEHRKLQWHEVEEDVRYIERYGASRTDEFKREVVGDGWIERYRTLQKGMKDGLTNQNWRQRSRLIAYNAFGLSVLGRWGGWEKYSLYASNRLEPWPLAWDGTSSSYYVNDWDSSTDYRVMSPQVQSMNWVFMQKEAYNLNPEFWFEISTWDGHVPAERTDKREFYARRGQVFSPERYEGFVQFGMWLLRPRIIREFRGWRDTAEHSGAYFMAVVNSVDRVHNNPILRRFWRKGDLVVNPDYRHPYQISIPKDYQGVQRWFLLSTDKDPKRPWDLETELPVFSIALVIGKQPTREWLVYAHSPIRETKNVTISLPGYGQVTIDSSPRGVFYQVFEANKQIVKL